MDGTQLSQHFFKENVDFREKGEKQRVVVPLIYAFCCTGCSLYVLCLEIEPATLAYWEAALTNRATRPGLSALFTTPQ